MLVPIENIKVKRRVRKDLGNLDSLKDSLKRYGLLNPITINSDNELVAGQRRLEAAKQLGWTSINVIVIDTKNKISLLEMELEENNQRLPFNDLELLEGYKQLEKLKNPSIWMRIINAIKAFFIRLFGKKRK